MPANYARTYIVLILGIRRTTKLDTKGAQKSPYHINRGGRTTGKIRWNIPEQVLGNNRYTLRLPLHGYYFLYTSPSGPVHTTTSFKHQQSIEYDSPFPNGQLGIGKVYISACPRARVIFGRTCATATPSRPCFTLTSTVTRAGIMGELQAQVTQGVKLGAHSHSHHDTLHLVKCKTHRNIYLAYA